MEELLSVRGLERRYGERTALRGFDLRISRGEVLGLLGPNGAGKTTCLQILSGNLSPTAGEVRVCGLDLRRRPRQAKRHLGYLPECPPLYPEMRVDEYLTYCARLRRIPGPRIGQALKEVKTQCGLAADLRRRVRDYSRGMRQKLGVIQALQHDPELAILDEPTEGLDPLIQRAFYAILEDRRAAGRTIFFSSHILPEVQAMCTRVMILRDGRVLHEAHLARQPNVRAPGRYRVRLSQAPPLTSLTAIPGVASTEALTDDAFRVTLRPGEPADALAARLVEQGLGLIELTPDRDNLEQVFFDILSGEQAA